MLTKIQSGIKKINTGEVDLEYSLTGKEGGETLLFVHGLGANLMQFDAQHHYFQTKYQVLSVSLRGHGATQSQKKLSQEDYKLNKMGQDIVILLNKLKIDKVHFIGNSMGGNIGYELLESDRDRLLSITTFGTTAVLNKSKFYVYSIKLIYKLFSMNLIAKLSKSVGQTQYSKQIIYDMFSQASKETLLNIIQYLTRFDYTKTIKNNPLPTLIIRGEKDGEINRILASTLSAYSKAENFRLVEIKGAGHFSNLDRPSRFNQLLSHFITTIRS